MSHTSVLLNEAVDTLIQTPSGIYVDGTYGRGGHSRAILNRLNESGRLLVMDKDPEAIAHAQSWAASDKRISVAHDSFAAMGQWIAQMQWTARVDGVLLDLGVSSPQLDEASRGFSFLQDGPLDMRMNPNVGISAAQWLNSAAEQEIADVIYQFGEERYSRRIAKAITTLRQQQPFLTTHQLAAVISQAHPRWEKGKHPATRTFQAIRIFINHELDDVQTGLQQALDVLRIGGRFVVISFHSLEDRLVKRFIVNKARGQIFPRGLPVSNHDIKISVKKIGKSVRASTSEVARNSRARSAIMRVGEKIA
jgi:16S rRNA (cytosine1402-N4)-methyltransferase